MASLEELKAELLKKEQEIQRLKNLVNTTDNGTSLKIVTAHTLDEGANKMPVTSKLSNQDISRYSRQLILPELGVKGQINLKNSSVLIVGAGGLGCPAAIYLAAAGIGRLGVVDYDAVELSNLHRQILHSENRISVPKSLSIAQSCQQLNSSIEYVPYQLQMDSTNALDIIRKYDIVLDATDNVATRYLLNDACVLEGKPLISGSALRFEGQLTVYNHNGGPCYRCLFPLPPPPETVTNCSEGGVIGVVPGIIGSLQALEAIKMASGIGTSYCRRLLMFDALDGTFHTPTLRPRSVDCCMCGDQPTISQLIDYEQFCGARACDKNPDLKVIDESSRISPKEYSTMLTDGVPHVLVDVRSAVETEICALPHPALNIPLTTLTRDRASATTEILQAVDNVAKEMSNDNIQNVMPVVFVCRRGNDSQLAVRELQEKLRDRDLRIVDIERGLYGWSRQVDQEFPVY